MRKDTEVVDRHDPRHADSAANTALNTCAAIAALSGELAYWNAAVASGREFEFYTDEERDRLRSLLSFFNH